MPELSCEETWIYKFDSDSNKHCPNTSNGFYDQIGRSDFDLPNQSWFLNPNRQSDESVYLQNQINGIHAQNQKKDNLIFINLIHQICLIVREIYYDYWKILATSPLDQSVRWVIFCN